MRLALAGILLCGALSYGQFETSEVLGTVRDPSGSPVSKAKVTLLNQNTGIQASTTTNDAGEYDFVNVKVGSYTLTVEMAGFSKFTAPDIKVDVEARQRVDAKLTVGVVTNAVTVTAAASALETDSSEHGQVINTQQVAELPLNGRNYADLALLSTNTIKSPIAVSFAAERHAARRLLQRERHAQHV